MYRPSTTSNTESQAIISNSLDPNKASLVLYLTGRTLTLVIRQRPMNPTPNRLLTACQAGVTAGHLGQADQEESVVVKVDLPSTDRETVVTIAQEHDIISLWADDNNDTSQYLIYSLFFMWSRTT